MPQVDLMRRSLYLLALGLLTYASPSASETAGRCPAVMTSAIPKRTADALTGSQFAAAVNRITGAVREQAIEAELLAGNVPAYLRLLRPVNLKAQGTDGRSGTVTICVTPDYLAIGSASDFLRVPMALPTAMHVVGTLGFMLPTRRMVDAIYDAAAVRFSPEPLPAGDAMRSTAYYVDHNLRIAAQRAALGATLGELMAGHKKDLVITNRLRAHPERVAIYGWHRPGGQPIQPLSTVHGARYADYSHGVRLVSLVGYVNGRPRSLIEVLDDPQLAALISDEGTIPHAAQLFGQLGGALDQALVSVAGKASELTGLVMISLGP